MKPSDLHDLVIANRILANEGVVDAFGHVSIRNPEDPNRYFQSRSRAPELVTAVTSRCSFRARATQVGFIDCVIR